MPTVRIAAGCLSLLLATSAWADLKVYDVDFKYQREVYRALQGILIENPQQAAGSAYGRVELLPTGQILVDAAPATHAQIEQLLAAVRARQADAAPRVRFRYWAVLGSRAAQTDGDVPSSGRRPRSLSIGTVRAREP